MNTIKNIALLFGLLLVIAGCASSELSLQGSRVNVGKESDIERCQMLGSTSLSLSPLLIKWMKEEKIKEQLTIEGAQLCRKNRR